MRIMKAFRFVLLTAFLLTPITSSRMVGAQEWPQVFVEFELAQEHRYLVAVVDTSRLLTAEFIECKKDKGGDSYLVFFYGKQMIQDGRIPFGIDVYTNYELTSLLNGDIRVLSGEKSTGDFLALQIRRPRPSSDYGISLRTFASKEGLEQFYKYYQAVYGKNAELLTCK